MCAAPCAFGSDWGLKWATMKVKWLFATMALLGLALAGCGSGDKAPEGTTGSTGSAASGGSTDKKLKIAVSIPAGDHGWTAGIVWWANKMKADHPEVDMEVQTSADGTKQADAVQTMLLKQPDGLVVLSFEPAPVTPQVKKAKDAGVYVVSVDRGLTEPIADVWVRGDNSKFGEMAADYMGEKLNGKGNILALEGMTNDVNTARVEAFKKEIAAKYPGIKVLDWGKGDWNREKAYQVVKTELLKFPQVDAMWSSDDDMSLGAEKAIKEAGRNFWMLGGGGMKDVVKKIMDKDPMYPATITYSPKMIADAIERCIADLKAGKKPGTTQEDQVIPVEVVTPENAKDFYFEDSDY